MGLAALLNLNSILTILPHDAAKERLEAFIYGDPDSLTFTEFLTDEPAKMWRFAGEDRYWDQFSELPLRLLSIPTGEADVERMISSHRRIIGINGSRMKKTIAMARLRLTMKAQT
jgi:hypothetical protein